MNTDTEWEKWGRQDPYFGVLTDERFRSHNMTEDARSEFFATGEHHVETVLDMCRRHVDPKFNPRRMLDFGCGVGRLIVPFSKRVPEVVGVDVSNAMLEEALANCRRFGIENAELVCVDGDLKRLGEPFDFVHTFIVLQHVPPDRGLKLFKELLDVLKPGGVGALHLTYAKRLYADNDGAPPPPLRAFVHLLPRWFRLRRGPTVRASEDPEMQMNCYDLNRVFFSLQRVGVMRSHVEFTDHGGELGVFVCFAKETCR